MRKFKELHHLRCQNCLQEKGPHHPIIHWEKDCKITGNLLKGIDNRHGVTKGTVLGLVPQMVIWGCCGPCNPSKWEADIWGWLEVGMSTMLHYTVNQRPQWACWQYGHSWGTQGWLGVERSQLCLQDTSRSSKWHPWAAVGHCVSLCVCVKDGW